MTGLQWCGTHEKAGPAAIYETFVNVGRHWESKDFSVRGFFGSGGDVAVFGSFTYMSRYDAASVACFDLCHSTSLRPLSPLSSTFFETAYISPGARALTQERQYDENHQDFPVFNMGEG